MSINIRDACKADASFVGWTMLTAIGMGDRRDLVESDVWQREDILYSWKRSRVVTVDGKTAGCLISYPGEDYEPLRVRTWNALFGETEEDAVRFESETFPGEYYLDSLAVLPEYRGRHLGADLIRDGIAKGKAAGFERITLIVDVESEELFHYYCSMGFCMEGRMFFFGHMYFRMVYVG